MERHTITCNAAISACGKALVWPRAVDFLVEISAGVKVGFLQLPGQRRWQQEELRVAMADAHVKQCTFTYSAAVGACKNSGTRLRDIVSLALTAEGCVEWGTINHNAAVSACVKATKGLRDME